MSEVKPPITDKLPQFKASDEEIKVVIKSEHLDRTGMPLVEQRMTAMTIILITGLLKAQRDADWEHEQRAVREIFEEIICPMCYRLNPQHAPSGDYKGCHSCQEKEKWCGQSRVEKEVLSGHQS